MYRELARFDFVRSCIHGVAHFRCNKRIIVLIKRIANAFLGQAKNAEAGGCLLYTSDAADD